ncbi:MAG: PAS domain S-box protein [Polyangiaceae bacterium]
MAIFPAPFVTLALTFFYWSSLEHHLASYIANAGAVSMVLASFGKHIRYEIRVTAAVAGAIAVALPALLAFGPTFSVGLLFIHAVVLSSWLFNRIGTVLVYCLLTATLLAAAFFSFEGWNVVEGPPPMVWLRIASLGSLALSGVSFACRTIRKGQYELLLSNRETERALRSTSARLSEQSEKAEHAVSSLQQTEAKFQQLVAHVSDAIIFEDTEGKTVSFNDRFIELFGINPALTQKISVPDFVAPEWTEPFREYKSLQQSGKLKDPTFEIEGMRQDGTRLWLEGSRTAIRNPEGQIVGYQTALRDVTERNRSVEALIKSQNLFERLVEAVPVGVFHTNARGLVEVVNPSWCKLAGITEQEAVGAGWQKAIHPDDKELFSQLPTDLFNNQNTAQFEHRFLHADGRVVWVLAQVRPVRNASGEVTGYTGTLTDITLMKESNARTAALLAVQPDAMYVIDAKNTFVDVEVKQPEEYYSPPDQVLGRTLFEVLPEDVASTLSTLVATARSQQRVSEAQYSIHIRGELRYREARAVPYLNNALILVRDITTRRLAEIALTERKELLRLSQEIAQLGSWSWDVQTGKLDWSDGMYQLHGVVPRSFSPTFDRALEFYSVDDRIRIAENIQRAMVTGEIHPDRLTVTWPNGQTRIHRVSWKLYRDEVGAPTRMVGVNWDITEQEAQFDELELAKYALSQATDAYNLIAPDGRFIDVNRAACTLLGYSREEMLQRKVADIDPSIGDDWDSHWQEVKERRSLSFETTVNTKHGALVPIEVSLNLLLFRGRQYISSVVRDISQRKQAEQELKASQQHYQSLFDEALEGVFRSTREGLLIDANPAFVKLTGYASADDLVGTSLSSLFAKRNDENALIQLLNNGQILDSVEMRWQKRSGEIIIVELSARALPDPHGRATQVQGFVRDVTEIRARAARERSLLEHKEQLELVLEGTQLGFWDWNPQTGSYIFSDRWAEMLGYQRDELVPQVSKIRELLNPDDLELVRTTLRRHMAGETAYFEAVHRLKHKDGHWVYVLNRGKVFDYDRHGKVTRFCGTHTDISLQKNAEQAAVESNQAKTMFLANMSHELRTPLNAVLGLSDALLSGAYGALSEKQERSLRTIHSSGRHLLDLINDVLDISRVEAGKMSIELRELSIEQIVAECVALTHDTLVEKDQKLSVEISPASLKIKADPKRTKQILLNLITNASKFCPSGARVEVGAKTSARLPGFVEIWVQDNGPGISVENQTRIFEPFVTLDDSYTRAQGGVGLGLPLVRRLAQLHGGTVTLSSELGGGARFVVALPSASKPAVAFVLEKEANEIETRFSTELLQEALLVVFGSTRRNT